MKARKKPVMIETFKYDGDFIYSDGTPYVPKWAITAEKNGVFVWKGQGDLYIKTLEGDMLVTPGDYVIRGVRGELYPCKPDIFEQTYEIEGEQEKRIVGEYRLFHRNKRYGIERSGDMEEGIDLVFVGMLIEVLAHEHEVSPEKMTEILLDGIEKHPVEFKEEEK